ncbi:tetratricopeptide repeat protein [Isosphaeraceae bacterium EP7]
MPKRVWIAALSIWPGLPQIWSGQEVLGLILAALFAAALNLAVVTRFIWTESFDPRLSGFFVAIAVLGWAASLCYTLWWIWRCHPERHRDEIDRLYRDAIESYLQGRWNESRRRFEQILTMDETDADTLMRLGTLFVRTEQPGSARRAFRQCLELEGGAKWRWEINRALAGLDGD